MYEYEIDTDNDEIDELLEQYGINDLQFEEMPKSEVGSLKDE